MRQKDLQELKRRRRLRRKLARVQRRKTGKGEADVARKERCGRREAELTTLLALPSSQAILAALDEEFERDIFTAALRNLTDSSNPIRFNNFAYAMREVIETILRKSAPSEDVECCGWYENTSRKGGRVTRAERLRYTIQGGLSLEKVADLLSLDEGEENQIEALVRNFPKLFQSLNEHTHVQEATYDIGDRRTEELADEVLAAVHEIVELVASCRQQINQHVSGRVDDAVLSEFLASVFPHLDLLSTHTTIEGVQVENHRVERIEAGQVVIQGTGTVYVDLQYGSGADMRNDMGAMSHDSFPFEFECTANISDLDRVDVAEQDIEVDTSSFYE